MLPNGRYAPIYYDSNQRGYGFWDDFGKWIILDSILNHNRGGYVQQPMQGTSYPVQSNGYPMETGGVRYSNNSSSGSPVFGFFIIIVIVGGCVWLYLRRSNNTASPLTGASGKDEGFGASMMPPTTMSKTKPTNLDSWINLLPGAFITLSDQQALQDSKDRGEGLKGIDYKVESLAVAKDSEGFGSWVLLNLNDGHQKLLLLIKGVDELIDHRIYYESPEFRPDRREDVVARGDTWLFDNGDTASPNAAASLRYAAEINYATNGNEVRYILKDQGERHADYSEKPSLSGAADLVVTLVEYSTGDPTDNPEMLVLEIGAAGRRTGEVSLYFGCAINPSEIDIVKA
ncbi:MAG: hypothetical protein JWL59_4272 [Chthoniobacteraceae bacterium]|nr:hypothetical protein [Chthoniobacteraceae bacterium]